MYNCRSGITISPIFLILSCLISRWFQTYVNVKYPIILIFFYKYLPKLLLNNKIGNSKYRVISLYCFFTIYFAEIYIFKLISSWSDLRSRSRYRNRRSNFTFSQTFYCRTILLGIVI